MSTEREPMIHDWRVRCWGNDYTGTAKNGGLELDLLGWRLGLQAGDVLLLYSNGLRTRAAYVIEAIRYCGDPRDMFEAHARYEEGLVTEVGGKLVLTRATTRTPEAT